MMKKGLALLLAISMLTAAWPAAGADAAAVCTDYSGSNANAQDYKTWAGTVKSYLSVCEDGSLMRFQYAEGNEGYVAEYYDSSYQLLSTQVIDAELPVFGGFYASEDNYFILTGQENKNEFASVECYRVTKYDKNWKRIDSTGLYDCNTTVPFRAGSARMEENGDILMIRTCHEMYTSDDGKNHQANVTILLDMDTMQVVNSYVKVENQPYGYVSHSFNQFIKNDNGKIVAVDHGDAYPRSVTLIECDQDSMSSWYSPEYHTMLEIPGRIGDNNTGVSVGGFEFSDTSYVVAGNKIDFDSADQSTRNVFVAAMDKETKEITVSQITSSKADEEKISTPQLVKTDEDGFVLLWGQGDQVYYTRLNGNGQKTGKTYQMEGSLSDCVPLIYNEKIVWYTWKDSMVTFYGIDVEKITKTTRTEVQSGHEWECKSVKKHTATLQCTKCGEKKKVDTPESAPVWWQKTDSTDGYYRSAFTNPFQLGEGIRYWIAPESKKTPATKEECRDFVLEYSDPDAVEILPDEARDGLMGTILFKKPGKYTLTVRHIYDSSLKKEFTFIVDGQPESVSLNKKSITLNPKKTYTLTPAFAPEGTTATLTWKSGDKKVATVKDGKVTAVGVGKTKITVTMENGKKATCTVTVKAVPESVKLSKKSLTLKKGDTYSLKTELTPSDAYTTYTWTSSNKKVATVDKKGKVTAVGKGTATITVKTANGKKATCKVKVE